MTPLKGIKAIRELSEHSLSWGKEGNTETKEMDVVLDQISNFNRDMNIITEEEKEKEQFRKFLKKLQQLSINIPFIEALEQMPKYAKFMKDLLSKKGRMEETSRITLNERCSAILLNKIPLKEKDPGSFTIPCIIGNVSINKALADLGKSISLMPYSMFTRLGLGELKPTCMCIELANKTTQYPRGITDNVIVKIDKFVFPVDFVVLDMEEDHKIPIILG
ncbi:uncharacterized protein Tco_1073057 [Tanacetum coccineum]